MFSFPGFVSCLLPKKQTRIYYIRNTAKEVSLLPKVSYGQVQSANFSGAELNANYIVSQTMDFSHSY